MAVYPEMMSFESYQNELKQAVSRATTNYIEDAGVKDESLLSTEQRLKLEDKRTTERENTKRFLRKSFFSAAMRYVHAFCFYETLKTIKSDSKYKMYSTETIGWTDFKYPVRNDILFHMKSNFGYGNSSYHFINLTYKGIDILPYSALVQYYRVNTAELTHYTRQYRPSHENWEPAFDFVVETANLAISDESAFVSKWIVNEIDEMISGLRMISTRPKESLKIMLDKSHSQLRLLHVRDAFRSDRNTCTLYEDEASIAYKAEKISSALDFLDKLEAMKDAYPKVVEAIDEIKRLNMDLLPEIEKHVDRIEKEINRRQAIVDERIKEMEQLKAEGKPHYDEIQRQITESRSKGQIQDSQIETKYLDSHPDFKELHEKVKVQTIEISKEQSEISMRKNFVTTLNECNSKIEKHLNMAA